MGVGQASAGRQRCHGEGLREEALQERAGARRRRASATTTFVQREIGDVLLAWENEALLAIKELGPDKVQIVVPSLSILAEPSVSVVDKVVLRRGTREVATEYLNHLYSKEGQEIIAKNYYRPRDAEIAAKYAAQYPKLNLVTIQEFGGWAKAQAEHFSDKRRVRSDHDEVSRYSTTSL